MTVSSLSSWMHNVSHQRSYSASTVLFDSLIDWNLVCEGATWDGELTSRPDSLLSTCGVVWRASSRPAGLPARRSLADKPRSRYRYQRGSADHVLGCANLPPQHNTAPRSRSAVSVLSSPSGCRLWTVVLWMNSPPTSLSPCTPHG